MPTVLSGLTVGRNVAKLREERVSPSRRSVLKSGDRYVVATAAPIAIPAWPPKTAWSWITRGRANSRGRSKRKTSQDEREIPEEIAEGWARSQAETVIVHAEGVVGGEGKKHKGGVVRLHEKVIMLETLQDP